MAESRTLTDSTLERASELAWAGHHPAVIELTTAALAATVPDPRAQIELRDLRAESLLAIGDFAAALREAQAMRLLATRSDDLGAKSRALCRLSLVKVRLGDPRAAARAARDALSAARRVPDPRSRR